MKEVLIGIQPKWCAKIANGEKTIEVRKSRPKLQTPFKVRIYCTNDKKVFLDSDCNNKFWTEKNYGGKHFYNGKVIGEFVCDRIDEYLCEEYEWDDGDVSFEYRIRSVEGRKTCLDYEEIREYGKEKPLYFWHISQLKIYNKPKDLREFRKPCPYTDGSYCIERKCEYYGDWTGVCRCWVERPPQSWCYVKELGDLTK